MKRIFSLLIIVTMIMSTVAFAEGTDFSDIPADAWYKEYVSALTSKGIMTGYDNKNFGPDDICTRAQFVTLLYRGAGEPEATTDTSFADVNPDEYYADAVVWAKEASITNGYEDGNFGVDDMLTRSHVVAFIYRYVDYVNGNLSLKADLSSYADANLIEDYAKEPFSWAIANKIVLGTSDTTLEPNTLASRAQVAAILSRVLYHEHKWNSGELVKKATETENGEILYTCLECNGTKTESVDYGTEIVTRADLEEAIAELAWDFCMKKGKIQYDSVELDVVGKYYGGRYRCTEGVSPEDGTSHNTSYTVCSDYVYRVYDSALNYKLFGAISLDAVTRGMWLFAENQADFESGEYFNPGKPEDDVDSALIRWMSDEYLETADAEFDKEWGVMNSTHFVKTKEEFQKFLLNWNETMRPGDVLVNKGHAELYVGNGKFLDSNGQKYDRATNETKVEESGTIYRTDVVIDHPERKEWLDWFTNTTRLIVFRPTDFLVCEDTDGDLSNDISTVTIPDSTKSRIKYPAMDIDRTVDITPYGTTYKGQELTYKTIISNCTNDHNYLTYKNVSDPQYTGEKYKNLMVTETIPEGTELVEGSILGNGMYENGKITWNIDVEAGETVETSYKVKVVADKGVITNAGGFVDNIPSNSISNTVYGKKLSDSAIDNLKKIAASDTEGWTYGKDMDFANNVYKAMDISLTLPDLTDVVNDIFEWKTIIKESRSVRNKSGAECNVFMLSDDSEYRNIKDIMIDGYWGGYYFFTGMDAFQTTINEFKMDYLEEGDILVYVDADENGSVTGSQVMVYAGDNMLLSANVDGSYNVYTGEDADAQLWKAFMKDVELFFALRPSQAN